MKRWRSGIAASSGLLIDTQALVWLLTGDARQSPRLLESMASTDVDLFVSAVTAWEYSDLRARRRLQTEEDIAHIQGLYGIELLDFPADAWSIAAELPQIHRDPVDRMLVAHAVHSGLTLVTADAAIGRYPVRTLW